MNQSSLQFQISQLRQEKVIYALESIAVFIFSLFVSALLPQLLFRYVYADQQLTAEPKLLEYIPLAAFVLGAGFFIYAMIGNFMRMGKIRRLESELESSSMMGDLCCAGCAGDCDCSNHEGCVCGCDESMGMGMMEEKGNSTQMLAEKMKGMSKKKKASRKK
jgi:hypothetical protein